MPRTKAFAANAGSAELNAMVERVAPSILELLADGVPRRKPAIVEALAGRHDKQDVVNALIRLSITGQVEEMSGKYTLASGPAPDVG
jgi:HEAT repeat protein